MFYYLLLGGLHDTNLWACYAAFFLQLLFLHCDFLYHCRYLFLLLFKLCIQLCFHQRYFENMLLPKKYLPIYSWNVRLPLYQSFSWNRTSMQSRSFFWAWLIFMWQTVCLMVQNLLVCLEKYYSFIHIELCAGNYCDLGRDACEFRCTQL